MDRCGSPRGEFDRLAVPPAVPIFPIIARIRSLAVTPARARPRRGCAASAISSGRGFAWPGRVRPRWCRCRTQRAERAMSCRVAVAADDRMPGWVRPNSGPMTWTMRQRVIHAEAGDAELLAVASSVATCLRLIGSRIGSCGPWSGCCGPWLRRHVGPADLAPARRSPRTPAGWSPRGRSAGQRNERVLPVLGIDDVRVQIFCRCSCPWPLPRARR